MSIYFKSHTIPDIKKTALSPDRIFYHFANSIFSYDIKTNSHSKLFDFPCPSSFSVYESTLCLNHSNRISIKSTNEHSNLDVVLDSEPIQVLQYKNRIGIVYDDKVELIVNHKIKQLLNEWNTPLNIKRIANNEEKTFILTSNNEIFTCRNIFTTEQITKLEKMKIEIKGNISEIHCHKNDLFICYNSEIYTPNNNIHTTNNDNNTSNPNNKISKNVIIEKYSIDPLEFMYSFNITANSQPIFHNDYVATDDSLVHLSKAPFLIVKDRLTNISHVNSMLIGISSSRIYFIQDNVETNNDIINDYTIMKKSNTIIDMNGIKVPDFIKDERQKTAFLNNEITLKKYEIILSKINEIDSELALKEKQDEETYKRIAELLESIERRTRIIEDRISEMKLRAERSKFKGDTRMFYEKIRKIEDMLEEREKLDLSKYKMRLIAQREILKK